MMARRWTTWDEWLQRWEAFQRSDQGRARAYATLNGGAPRKQESGTDR